ncbi:hypothetical protein [Labrys sp. WJW]|uniref:hypothetical protein n=1 Tax=Labrys sp. WJW TaxID=1737983 RepID=UPI0012EABECE|nr:hypothetical protein [Labrys sp. WJW]
MHTPSWFKPQVDIGSGLAVIGVIIAVVTNYNQLQNNQDRVKIWQETLEKQIAERRVMIDARFSAIEAKIAPIEAVQFRLGKQEADIVATNARVDRIVDSFSDQLKELRKDVNAVGTKVEVLTRSLED